MKAFLEVLAAGVLGFVFTLGGLLILTFLIGTAVGQESIATRPARLGEQDRSLNYPTQPVPHYQSQEHVYEFYAFRAEDNIALGASIVQGCQQRNIHLRYLLVDIAKHIARNPTLGYIYKGAIQAIHDAWCRQ